MKVTVSGKQLEMTEAIKEYAESKISKITKYLENIPETHVTLSLENTKSEGKKFIATATIYATGKDIRVEEESDDLYSAIDKMVDIAERQVRKHKEKMQIK